MTTYAWKIDSVNADAGTMIVTYMIQVPAEEPETFDEKKTTLNLPVPALGVVVGEWIDKFAPRANWVQVPVDNIVVGSVGGGMIEVPVPEPVIPPVNEQPNVIGAWNEEYLRAMIYQVIEEINGAAV